MSSIFYSGVMSYTEGTTVKVIYSRSGTKPSYGAQKVHFPSTSYRYYMKAKDVTCELDANHFSSLREKSSVYVDVEMCRVVLLYSFSHQGAIFLLYQGHPLSLYFLMKNFRWKKVEASQDQ